MRKLVKSLAGIGLSPHWLMAQQWIRGAGRRNPAAANESAAPRSILFSFPYQSVGDVVLVLTLLEQIHALWPAAAIDVLIGETMAALVGAIPYVREVLTVPRAQPGGQLQATYHQLGQIRAAFARQQPAAAYDLALAPRWDALDNLLSAYGALVSGAPTRCGYQGVNGQPHVTNPMLTHVAIGGAHEHESDRYTRLLARCRLHSEAGPVSIQHQPLQTLLELAQERRHAGLSALPVSQPFFLLAPGATSAMRMWPAESFAEVARTIQRERHWLPVVLGGPSEKSLCADLAERIGNGAVSVAGATTPLQMLDLMSAAELLIGNDSGPAHLSGALDRPTFVISPFPLSSQADHFNNPRRFHPIGSRTHVLQPDEPLTGCKETCESGSAHCILQVSPDTLLQAVRRQFQAEETRDASAERSR